MPCIPVKGGYKIRRSEGGFYPKIYPSKKACEERVAQMERFQAMNRAREIKKQLSK